MMSKPHQPFPFRLDPEQVSQLTFQFFNNHSNYTLKVYVKPTEDNGKVGSNAKRKAFMLVFPKSSNRQSINKMKRDYGHVKGLNDHCDALLAMSNRSSLFAQCRPLGQKNTYYKFFDAVLTPSHNGTVLSIKLHEDIITLPLGPSCFDEEPSKGQSIKLFHFILDSHEFDLDEMVFEPDLINTVFTPSFAKDALNKPHPLDDKKPSDASITDKKDQPKRTLEDTDEVPEEQPFEESNEPIMNKPQPEKFDVGYKEEETSVQEPSPKRQEMTKIREAIDYHHLLRLLGKSKADLEKMIQSHKDYVAGDLDKCIYALKKDAINEGMKTSTKLSLTQQIQLQFISQKLQENPNVKSKEEQQFEEEFYGLQPTTEIP